MAASRYYPMKNSAAEKLTKSECKETMASLESSSSSDTSIGSLREKYIKACCKPIYRMRWMKTKGAILVLVWNYLAFSVFYYLGGFSGDSELLRSVPFFRGHASGLVGVATLFCPFAGWLADVRLGRYKVICISLWTMWIGILLSVVGLLIRDVNDTASLVIGYGIFPLLYIVIALGIAAFQANIIQFGVDQLLDASAVEITAFVNWYVWTIYSSNTVVSFLLDCLNEKFQFIRSLVLAVILSLALCSNFILKKWLVVEPVIQNPLKLISKVLRYAAKNKYPRQRSAFTYWEDKIPSRIDLAKSKYGGPFTTEQVEDVKTFFRILVIIFSVGTIVSANIVTAGAERNMVWHLRGHGTPKSDSLSVCFQVNSIRNLEYYCIVLLVPLYEFIMRPMFQRCIPSVGMFQKFGIGMVLLLMNIVANQVLDVVGHQLTEAANGTVLCVLTANETSPSLDIDYRWLAIPGIIRGFSILFLLIPMFEFVCAQSPYSMKGLLLGIIYGTFGLMTILGTLVLYPFTVVFRTGRDARPSCGFWYFLVAGIIVLIAIVIFCFVGKWYKKRERDEEPNTQRFVEDYYERYSSN